MMMGASQLYLELDWKDLRCLPLFPKALGGGAIKGRSGLGTCVNVEARDDTVVGEGEEREALD